MKRKKLKDDQIYRRLYWEDYRLASNFLNGLFQLFSVNSYDAKTIIYTNKLRYLASVEIKKT